MDNKEGGSINRPPILDGTNYDYWKDRMTAFLRSIDNKTWKSIVKGWTPPVNKTTSENSSATTIELKNEEDWTTEEDEEAWDSLKIAHEGTSRVRMSRLQMLTTQFENLRMSEEQTIAEFHMQIRDIANTSFALGEKMSNEKLVRKILRSLPKRFAMKVTAIEEAQDITVLQVDELIGSLQTFEVTLNERPEKKNKSIAFVSNTETEDEETEADFVGQQKQKQKQKASFCSTLALLGRTF